MECPVKRYAIVTGGRTRREVEAYMPGNFEVIWEGQVPAYEGASYEVLGVVIEGEDSAGWGLDSYVRPRLQSGLMACTEIDLSHPVMKQVAA